MKALRKSRPEPGIWMETIQKPKPGPGEALIKISKTAICGTDLHIVKWDEFSSQFLQTPVTIGHEFVGTIAELGTGVTQFELGERVTGEGHITCGHCRNCRGGKKHLCPLTVGIGSGRDGAFAEYLLMPVANLWRVHDDVSSELAAIHDPLGNAVHTALSFDLAGQNVLITGAGPIGTMAALVSQFCGAHSTVLSDINHYRLELARKLGVQTLLDAGKQDLQSIRTELAIKDGFDIGLEMSGNETAFKQMLNHMSHGGHMGLLGFLPDSMPMNWDDIIFKGLTIKGIYGREMFDTWVKMTRLIHAGLNVENIITHRFPIDQYEQAFDVGLSGECGKIILEWD